jgi:hypothetical protein
MSQAAEAFELAISVQPADIDPTRRPNPTQRRLGDNFRVGDDTVPIALLGGRQPWQPRALGRLPRVTPHATVKCLKRPGHLEEAARETVDKRRGGEPRAFICGRRYDAAGDRPRQHSPSGAFEHTPICLLSSFSSSILPPDAPVSPGRDPPSPSQRTQEAKSRLSRPFQEHLTVPHLLARIDFFVSGVPAHTAGIGRA